MEYNCFVYEIKRTDSKAAIEHRSEENHYKIIEHTFGIDPLQEGLKAGHYKFPFEIEIPEWLPSSMHYCQTNKSLFYLGTD
jgi:hypothetical protein